MPVVLFAASRLPQYTKGYEVLITGMICALRMAQILLFPEWHLVFYNIDLHRYLPSYFITLWACFIHCLRFKKLNLQVAAVILLLALNMSMSEAKMELMRLMVIPYFVFSLAFAEPPSFINSFQNMKFRMVFICIDFLFNRQ